ncbi:putative GntR transcriptional regulatory protein [Nocardia neocaledoniensis NBRC 108232]|uniref:GntR family transcriptional regulator n=1 Tax=Nocardia neocaledoniensis TaxID=236511 RepID=A0A317N7V1_9NOCA|nr:GntR family transcriptional regulator [Nocardia neocaledoniensis]PWV68962.1 GntR family transcriptional regulator [Nocardia neocaledoniensis]GEM29602.1 putative GntR transcriptional regulatory protein [Nocardia neocaledoniensis NBRC 108232]
MDLPRVAPPTSLKTTAVQEIRRRIFAGELRPGDKIDQDEIADALGISKLPVREALIALELESIVDMPPRRGAFVAPMTRDDVRDHYWLLGVVSGLAAARAAERIAASSLDALGRILDRMVTASSRDRETLNFEFHRMINRASGSRRLLTELKVLGSAGPHGFYETHDDWSETADRDHREILAALRVRDADTARTVTEKHFLHGGDRAVHMLETRGFWK